MAPEYAICTRPFDMGTDKEAALKPLEEAAEAFCAWQVTDRHGDGVADVIYECCDVIQAACNLMWRVGATQEDVDIAMDAVAEANESRGRYGNDGKG